MNHDIRHWLGRITEFDASKDVTLQVGAFLII